jgi:hypothetical protein
LTNVGGGLSLPNVLVAQLPPDDRGDRTQQTQRYLERYFRDTYKLKVCWGDIREFSTELRHRLDKFNEKLR